MSVICIDDHPRFKAANHNAGLFPVPTVWQRVRQLKLERENAVQMSCGIKEKQRKILDLAGQLKSEMDELDRNGALFLDRVDSIDAELIAIAGKDAL